MASTHAGLQGSTRFADYAVLKNKLVSADLSKSIVAQIGAQSKVSKNVPLGEGWFSYPAMAMNETRTHPPESPLPSSTGTFGAKRARD